MVVLLNSRLIWLVNILGPSFLILVFLRDKLVSEDKTEGVDSRVEEGWQIVAIRGAQKKRGSFDSLSS